MTEEIITLMSLDNVAEANIIKTKLETQGIACFMNNRKSLPQKSISPVQNIDIRVYHKDLDHALKLISDDLTGDSTPEKHL
ncbi:MAG: putative signal transducing protein [Bacteroidia bacterium]